MRAPKGTISSIWRFRNRRVRVAYRNQADDAHHDEAERHHDAERPVGDDHQRDVIAGTVLLFVLCLEFVDAFDFAGEVVAGQEAHHVRNADRPDFLLAAQVANGQQGEGSGLFGFPNGFERSQFHRLDFRHVLSHGVTAEEDQYAGDQARPAQPFGRSA